MTATCFIGVTFKSSTSTLVNMFNQSFSSVKEAKKSIEEDAKAWFSCHGKVVGKWMNPDREDYYMAVGKDGQTCIWQYYAININMA